MTNEDKVLVQPLSTYHEGPDRKSHDSEPYLASRSHAAELVALGIAKLVEPEAVEEDEGDLELDEGEDEDEGEEDEPEQPDDAAEAPSAPRRRGRPPRT